MNSDDSPIELINNNYEHWMRSLSDKGMSIFSDKTPINYGITPKDEEISNLVSWLENKEPFVNYVTHSLSHEYKKSLR